MPQKRNPDAAELIRGKSGRILGNYVSMFTVMKALPLAYSKDMQEDKEPLFDSIETTKDALKVMSNMIRDISFNSDKMIEMCEKGHILSTDVADWLVDELKIPFREAHNITGKIVALAEKKNLQIHNLNAKDFKKIDKRINTKLLSSISLKLAVENRNSLGGTSPRSTKKEIIFAKEKWLDE
tara:strand:- start:131 stop:676 length:546 start_codon:yes stop_codon:yes gene_type:complete